MNAFEGSTLNSFFKRLDIDDDVRIFGPTIQAALQRGGITNY